MASCFGISWPELEDLFKNRKLKFSSPKLERGVSDVAGLVSFASSCTDQNSFKSGKSKFAALPRGTCLRDMTERIEREEKAPPALRGCR